MTVRSCKHCGARVPVIARFCPYCGEELEPSEAEVQQKRFGFEKKLYQTEKGKITVVKLSGAIEAKDARAIRALFDELEKDDVARVVFCMKEVTYISSAALGLLVSFASDKKLAQGTHSVFLADVSQAVGGAMSVLGILPFFAVFPDLKSALAALGIEMEEGKNESSAP
ncbi:MAG: zinc-ribbon domain-containing protein [Planctomycetota bacterium]|nr:zinc-ribbon domain-containing protein [Planctomycetota bacterium]